MTVITVSMLIIFYRYSFYEETLNLIFLGVFILFSILFMYWVPREWKTRKELEKHDEVIE
jgi:ABC-type multidrug transport system permease subunit